MVDVELAVVIVESVIMFILIGFMTVKVVWWGLASVAALWAGAPLTAAFTREQLLADMLPRFSDILLFYPERAVPAAFDIFTSHLGGLLGSAFAVLVLVVGVIPYSVGIFLGITLWPELLIIRMVV